MSIIFIDKLTRLLWCYDRPDELDTIKERKHISYKELTGKIGPGESPVGHC